MRKNTITVSLIIFIFADLLLIGCGQQPSVNQSDTVSPTPKPADTQIENNAGSKTQPEPTKKPKRPPVDIPGDVPEPNRTLADSDSSLRADEHRVLSGDNFKNNLYERPFTSQEMIYQPDLDIQTVDFAYDDNYFYFTINVNGKNVDERKLTGSYGIEFDRTLTGRGDLIVVVNNAMQKWSPKNVRSFIDLNKDVGGPTPIFSDAGFIGDGYDKRTEINVDNLAFARLSPNDENAVQIAVSHALLDYPEKFLWGAWVDKGLLKLAKFDYNDAMSESEAGSPFKDSENYPIKALFNFDNTCRLPYGFDQMGASYPGMCITMAPTDEPDSPENNCYCNDLCVDGITCCGEIICP